MRTRLHDNIWSHFGTALGRSGKRAPPDGATIKSATDAAASIATAEVAPKEVIGSVGIRVHVSRHLDVFGSTSYDNSDAKLFRTGFNVKY